MQPTKHVIPLPNFNAEGTHEIALYDWGNPDSNQVAICVHGLTRNARDFDFLAQKLVAAGRRVLALSMAGRGESAWLADPMGYHYATYVADCLAVLDNFHIREVEFIGTSMGGIIGMMIAAQQPQRIKKLVLNDIGAKLGREALVRIYDYVRTMPTRFENRDAADTYLRAVFNTWGIRDERVWKQLVDASLTTRNGTLCYACDPAIIKPMAVTTKEFTEINEVNLSPIWNEIQTPTLILRGEQSDILSEETISGMRATNLNAESITYPNVGHAPALMTDADTDPILAWLDRTLASMIAVSF